MLELRRKWWLWGLTLLLILALAWVPIRVRIFGLNQSVQNGSVAEARADLPISQTFISHYPGLDTVILRLAHPLPPGNQLITFRLQRVIDNADVISQTLSLSEVLQKDDHSRFTFLPLDDSVNVMYRMVIETSGPDPVRLVMHDQNLYDEGERQGGGDLVFRLQYNGWLRPTLQALLARMVVYRPGLLGRPELYLALAFSYLAALLIGLGRCWQMACAALWLGENGCPSSTIDRHCTNTLPQ